MNRFDNAGNHHHIGNKEGRRAEADGPVLRIHGRKDLEPKLHAAYCYAEQRYEGAAKGAEILRGKVAKEGYADDRVCSRVQSWCGQWKQMRGNNFDSQMLAMMKMMKKALILRSDRCHETQPQYGRMHR